MSSSHTAEKVETDADSECYTTQGRNSTTTKNKIQKIKNERYYNDKKQKNIK